MFKFNHFNFNVLDLDKSIQFYKDALNLHIDREKEARDKSFKLVYLKDSVNSDFSLELTYLKNRKEPYNLGDLEYHLAFSVPNYEEAYELHKSMNCICYENPDMGIYFINDPDGYWIEIIR